MNRWFSGTLAIGVAMLFILLGAGNVVAKGKPSGGFGDPLMYFRGYVYDRESPGTRLANIGVDLYWITGAGIENHRMAVTSSGGYFTLTLKQPSKNILYTMYVGLSDDDGHWAEKRVLELPCAGQNFFLPRDKEGWAHPFQSYTHTPHSIMTYEHSETNYWTIQIGVDDYLYYQWSDQTISGTGHDAYGTNIICNVKYMTSGMFRENLPNPLEVLDVRCYGEPLLEPWWSPTISDWLTDPVPRDWPGVTITDWLGHNQGQFGYTTKVSTQSVGCAVAVPLLGQTGLVEILKVAQFERTDSNSDTLKWEVINTDYETHRYEVFVEGSICHIWMLPDVFPG